MSLEIVNFTEARKRLAEVMDRVADDRSPVIVTRQNAEPTVLISLAEYNRMTETMYLMGTRRTPTVSCPPSLPSMKAKGSSSL